MDDLSSQLRDIHGLDPVSWWPLAPGWWISLAVVLAIIGALLWWRRLKNKTIVWQVDARAQIQQLEDQLPDLDDHDALTRFSELTRRVAIARTDRSSCAGLSGAAWTAWLSENDPNGFDWSAYDEVLIAGLYAPPTDSNGNTVDSVQLRELLSALKAWVADV